LVINFTEAYPHLIKFWDYNKNDKNPENAHAGSKLTYYFLCEKKHSFIKAPREFGRSVTKSLNCRKCNGTDKKKFLFKEKPFLLNHFDKNKNLKKAEDITTGTRDYVYLLCNNGHSFKRLPAHLYKSKKLTCNICSGSEVTTDNRLDLCYPELINEWDYSKNKSINPSEIAFNSNKKVHWICSENHSWEQGISNRTGTRYKNKAATKCPYCYQPSRSRNELILFSELHQFFQTVYSSHRIHGKELDIYIEDLNLAIEYDGSFWHQDKQEQDLEKNKIFNNNNIDILRVRENNLPLLSKIDFNYNTDKDLFGAITKILNYILKTYELEKYTHNEILNYISNKHITNIIFFNKIVDKYKIIKITDKKMFNEYSKENSLPLHYYGAKSRFKAIWKCSKCHNVWKNTILSRCGGSGCPECNGIRKQFNPEDSVFSLFPKLIKESLLDFNFKSVSPLSKNNLIEWQCSKCNKNWKSTLFARIKNKNRCPNCGFHILFKDNFLRANPELKKEWSTTNGNLNPEFLPIEYPLKLDWKCSKSHIEKETIKNKILKKRGCIKCEKEMIVYNLKRLEKEWDYNKNIIFNPKELKVKSRKKVWWKCEISDDHKWESEITNRVNRGCPYCSNKEGFTSTTNRLDIIHPDIAEEWDFNLNDDRPEDYTFRSGKKKHWNCKNCHFSFESKIKQRVDSKGYCKSCKKRINNKIT
jgi:rubrerythrin